jgi:outer membrane murein-binding lipoprotein Lpp
MKSQTARHPKHQRPARSAKGKKYVKQTAHISARRDGKPLIFGWGGHLSHVEKTRLQRRAIWTVTTLIALLVIAVFVINWININVVAPNKPLTTVNGQGIPQSDYRKMVAVQAQFHANKLKGPEGLITQRDSLKTQIAGQQKIIDQTKKQIEDLNAKIKKLPAGPSAQRTDLTNQLNAAQKKQADAQKQLDESGLKYQSLLQAEIPQEEQLNTQSQVGNDSADWLQQDAIIRQWLDKQNASIHTKIDPSVSAINANLNTFKANLPKGTSYQQFLSSNNLTDNDVKAIFSVKVRRENMQKYLSEQVKSPSYQVLARGMTLQTKEDAQKVLDRLKKGENFGKVAQEKSADSTTNTKGGDLGWMAPGQYALTYAQNASATIDNWIFDPARKLDELSPILQENGTFHVIQIMAIDPSRKIEDQALQSLKESALSLWILKQKALPGMSVTPIDQQILLDPANMPAGLPASPPAPPNQQQQQQVPQDLQLPQG